MEKKSFIDRHPNITSVVSVVVWFVVMALMGVFGGCKTAEPTYVEIVKTDTLHVYHTDTLREVRNDTIGEKVVVTVHDSIVKTVTIKEVVNEEGTIIHSEKETNNEVWHEKDSNSSLVQHTVDSLLKVKMDSVYNAKNEGSVVVMEPKKSLWEKTSEAIQKPFVFIGVVVVIIGGMWLLWKLKK